MTHEEKIGDESTLEDDGDVGGVEEFNVVLGWVVSVLVLVLDIYGYLESLKK